jgi:hypothetical protein
MRVFQQRTLAAAAMTAALFAAPAVGRTQHIPDIPERAKGAERVVVAQISGVNATMERNEFGDELIVSHATLTVEEVLKGGPEGSLVVDVDGGTLNGLTLTVSSLPTIERGERAVFFLTPGKGGAYRPHLRGLGILKLDSSNKVKGSSLKLDEVRRMANPNAR